jgi:hypothetical protein
MRPTNLAKRSEPMRTLLSKRSGTQYLILAWLDCSN